jgi:hypothetical protein
MGVDEMSKACESGEEKAESPAADGPPKPRRGAFPTPKSEIQNAKPYIPGVDETVEHPESKSISATDVEDDQEG